MTLITLLICAFVVLQLRKQWTGRADTRQYDERMVHPQFYKYCNELFAAKIAFYQSLDQRNKAKFIFRVQEFIQDKEWKGFNGFEVNSEHRALISACAVVLTFGMRDFGLSHIKRIFIAPEIFYSRLFERDVKGLTMPYAVYLSWEDCAKGIDVTDDAYNLCLHEFAHALDLAVKVDNADARYIALSNLWEEQSEGVFNKMNENENYNIFLREYAAVNKHEFFAVCVENFFERPKIFKENESQLYLTLCRLLNTNPLNPAGNYKLETSYLEFENDSFIGQFNVPFSLKLALYISAVGFMIYLMTL